MASASGSTRGYPATPNERPPHLVNPFTTGHPMRLPATTMSRAPTPQVPHPHMRTLRHSSGQLFRQQPTISQPPVDGVPQNQDQMPGQSRNSHEPTGHQTLYNERSTSRQAYHERPPSRNVGSNRLESHQYAGARLESRQYPNSQAEIQSPQYPNTRPGSRQSQHQGLALPPRSASRQDQISRPAIPSTAQDRPGPAQQSRPVSRQDGRATPSMAQDRPPSRSSRPPSRLSNADQPLQSHRLSERQHSRHNDAEGRAFRKGIADTTIAAINRGLSGVDVRNTQRYTKLYYEDDRDLANWKRPPRWFFNPPPTIEVSIAPLSTLKGTRFLADTVRKHSKIGVLNFASATLPGGGFLTGARAQEESIARSSTLYVALTTPAARPFYATHAADDRRGFYTHSMIYSPDVHLFRDDDGAWLQPLAVDVVTSPAVNAGQVRRQGRSTPAKLEERIQETMHERMGRILALFERKKVRNLVLGSFGTGVFQNDVRAMAGIWYELLQAPGARFAGSFDHVVFAIPDESTAKQFSVGFRGRTTRHE